MNKEELVETRILEKMEVRRLTCCCLVSNSNNIQVTVLFTTSYHLRHRSYFFATSSSYGDKNNIPWSNKLIEISTFKE